ncbi:GerW family sporulation protein [Alkaliphilus sp. MSJ-5]|uniref:GerW family sporulation protein n=1 Tax=Alkaliphilus flagellatus TaxID=2841507 RepID=A0ABS6G4W5_9FIRM|nr:GerW family sporulation protein [Alkaliphilus flagellatus]MBU5677529.1 GerW family sporulation protein [Alkaliphilus flagellatus]
MSEHPIEALMKTTMESIKEMVDVNTIVGDAVETPDGTVIIPISRVSFGFASGGGEYINIKNRKSEEDNQKITKDQFPFAGGAGAGVSVQPVAFMVVGNGQMKLMSVDQNANLIDNIINSTPKMINSLQSVFSKNNKKNNGENEIISFQ